MQHAVFSLLLLIFICSSMLHAQQTKTGQQGTPCEISVSIKPEQQEICDGDTVHFRAESTGDIVSWNWDFGDGRKSSGKGSVDKTFSYTLVYDEGFSTSPTAPEGYSEYSTIISVKDRNGCTATDTTSITVHQNNLRQRIVPESIRCGEGQIKLHTEENLMTAAGPGFSTAPISWQWSTGDTTPEIFVSETNTYSVELKDQYGCKEKSRFSLKFPALAKNTIKVPEEVAYKDSFVLEATQQKTKVKYSWQHNSKPSKNAWKSFSNKNNYSGQAGESSGGIHWKSGRHYIRLIIENDERGGIYCSDTSDVKVMSILSQDNRKNTMK